MDKAQLALVYPTTRYSAESETFESDHCHWRTLRMFGFAAGEVDFFMYPLFRTVPMRRQNADHHDACCCEASRISSTYVSFFQFQCGNHLAHGSGGRQVPIATFVAAGEWR
jgi:hypothetical protein